MLKHYSFLFLFIIPLFVTAQSKKDLLAKVLCNAKDYKDIEQVWDIVKDYDEVLRCIPIIHPIAPKDYPKITSRFGWRFHPIDKKYKGHKGIDFVSEFAVSIHSTADGKVIFAGTKKGYGKCVIIQHCYGFDTVYAHLTGFYATLGQVVERGKIIGFLGNTGNSTGAHLHYEIRKNNIAINPLPFL